MNPGNYLVGDRLSAKVEAHGTQGSIETWEELGRAVGAETEDGDETPIACKSSDPSIAEVEAPCEVEFVAPGEVTLEWSFNKEEVISQDFKVTDQQSWDEYERMRILSEQQQEAREREQEQKDLEKQRNEDAEQARYEAMMDCMYSRSERYYETEAQACANCGGLYASIMGLGGCLHPDDVDD